jgi:hypothetical protein
VHATVCCDSHVLMKLELFKQMFATVKHSNVMFTVGRVVFSTAATERGSMDGEGNAAQGFPPCVCCYILFHLLSVHVSQPKALVPREGCQKDITTNICVKGMAGPLEVR